MPASVKRDELDAAIGWVVLPHDQSAPFQAIDQSGHIRVVAAEKSRQRGHRRRLTRPQEIQQVALRRGQPGLGPGGDEKLAVSEQQLKQSRPAVPGGVIRSGPPRSRGRHRGWHVPYEPPIYRILT